MILSHSAEMTPSSKWQVVAFAAPSEGDLTKIWCEAPKRFAQGGELCFDQVVIETTGLANLLPILHILLSRSRVAQQYRLDSVITTVDAVNGESTLNRQVVLVK